MKHRDDIALLVTAGTGPVECQQAVACVLERMEEESEQYGTVLSIHATPGQHGLRSAVVAVHGDMRQTFVRAWQGTIQWKTQSLVRRNHKRSNWFVGVFVLDLTAAETAVVKPSDVAFSTLRAGGPGGQHQNTTDSAVRALHRPSGLVVVARDARSQHRNKALALQRLQSLADAKATADHAQQNVHRHRLHRELERGNPVRRFSGPGFEEDRQTTRNSGKTPAGAIGQVVPARR